MSYSCRVRFIQAMTPNGSAMIASPTHHAAENCGWLTPMYPPTSTEPTRNTGQSHSYRGFMAEDDNAGAA